MYPSEMLAALGKINRVTRLSNTLEGAYYLMDHQIFKQDGRR